MVVILSWPQCAKFMLLENVWAQGDISSFWENWDVSWGLNEGLAWTSTIKSVILDTTNPKLKCFSCCLAVVFAQSIEAWCWVENEDVVGVAPTGDAPTTSEWATILLPTKVCLILEVWQYLVSKEEFGYLNQWWASLLHTRVNRWEVNIQGWGEYSTYEYEYWKISTRVVLEYNVFSIFMFIILGKTSTRVVLAPALSISHITAATPI